MKDMIDNLLNDLYTCLKYSLRDIILFPSDNTLDLIQYASAISIFSLVSYWLHFPTLLDWRGCFLGTAILGILHVIGRRSDYALSRDDGDIKDSIRDDASGEESTSSEREIN